MAKVVQFKRSEFNKTGCPRCHGRDYRITDPGEVKDVECNLCKEAFRIVEDIKHRISSDFEVGLYMGTSDLPDFDK